MTSFERMQAAVNHRQPDRVPIDFDATPVSGMHVSCVAELRDYYGLERRPVKIHEPYQCLGLIEEDLAEIIGTDVSLLGSRYTWFGFPNENWKPWKTPWGQEVLVAENFNISENSDGSINIYPQGDTSAPPSGLMPEGGRFFDEIIRQPPLPSDESQLKAEDNLEEFVPMPQNDIDELAVRAGRLRESGKFIMGNFGGLCLGDIACVPAPQLKNPKGIRDITEWYMSTVIRQPLLHEIFEKQYEIGIENLIRINDSFGEKFDAIFLCGTDFGTQESSFCSTDTFRELYLPHYRQITDWIHSNTNWKVFKHSCGSIPDFIPLFIEAGFDLLNPVQISAKGMDPAWLKKEFGKDITFWGGGIDTQKTLPFGNPGEVRTEVLKNLEIFSRDGGYIFNAIHNIQAGTPVENIAAMIEAVREFNGGR